MIITTITTITMIRSISSVTISIMIGPCASLVSGENYLPQEQQTVTTAAVTTKCFNICTNISLFLLDSLNSMWLQL